MMLAHRCSLFLLCFFTVSAVHAQSEIDQSSPLHEKAKHFQQDLLEKHWLDGLYVSIVPVTPREEKLSHTVDEPGNVIHAGVWTGRYLAGVAYQNAVTNDPVAREHGGQILVALRRLQEATGKPGLLARGYVKGHGPVTDYERDGRDSQEWHQGEGEYADYRWYGDVSVDNFNAVLYGYAIYYDLAADTNQRDMIRHDVKRLMTHLLDHHCRIVDVDGEVTRYGHVGIDPDPDRVEYYEKLYAGRLRFYGATSAGEMPLRASLMLLPDLLIAHRITSDDQYLLKYQQVIDRFKDNPEPDRRRGEDEQRRVARTNHSSEGQAYEALYNLLRYEQDWLAFLDEVAVLDAPLKNTTVHLGSDEAVADRAGGARQGDLFRYGAHGNPGRHHRCRRHGFLSKGLQRRQKDQGCDHRQRRPEIKSSSGLSELLHHRLSISSSDSAAGPP